MTPPNSIISIEVFHLIMGSGLELALLDGQNTIAGLTVRAVKPQPTSSLSSAGLLKLASGLAHEASVDLATLQPLLPKAGSVIWASKPIAGFGDIDLRGAATDVALRIWISNPNGMQDPTPQQVSDALTYLTAVRDLIW